MPGWRCMVSINLLPLSADDTNLIIAKLLVCCTLLQQGIKFDNVSVLYVRQPPEPIRKCEMLTSPSNWFAVPSKHSTSVRDLGKARLVLGVGFNDISVCGKVEEPGGEGACIVLMLRDIYVTTIEFSVLCYALWSATMMMSRSCSEGGDSLLRVVDSVKAGSSGSEAQP